MPRVAAYRARQPRLADELKVLPVPAPDLGTDAVSPASSIDPRHAFLQVNLIAGDRGLKPRPGQQEHETHVGATDGDVRSILPYHAANPSVDRLFATAPDGIYDCTVSGSTPTRDLAFATSNANSGYGENIVFTNSAGAKFMLYTDEVNGYLLYTESTDSWAVGNVVGVSATALVNVTQWGSRVWFTERDSTRAWYLAPGAIGGTATSFDFGPFFKAGGTLRGVWAWTRDGGDGMNDLLVAVSSNGDIVVFSGTDPAFSSTFGIVGRWNVGGVPAGRRLASPYGGDLQILTLDGLLSVNRLVTGEALTPNTYQTDSIRPLFTEAMALMSTQKGWHVSRHPRGSFLMVNTPGVAGQPQEQFAMSFATRGWSRLRGLNMLSSDVWQGEFYFGTRDGRVIKSTGFVDNVKLGGDASQAVDIECMTLGGFTSLGTLNRKVVRFYRPIFQTKGRDPAFEAFIRFDFLTNEPSGTLAPGGGPAGAWDSGVWDSALWGGLGGRMFNRVGAAGVGTYVALGVRFTARDYTVLVGYDLGVEEGGPL